MSKRLVVCCDGTWNTADRGGGSTPTNVTSLVQRHHGEDAQGVEQATYYHKGVGTTLASGSAVAPSASGSQAT